MEKDDRKNSGPHTSEFVYNIIFGMAEAFTAPFVIVGGVAFLFARFVP